MAQPVHSQLERSNRRKLVWGLVCLIAPTALFILSLTLYAFVNFVFSGISTPESIGPGVDCMNNPMAGVCAPPQDDNLFGETGVVRTVMNVALFLVGSITVLTWLPGIIVGIILLTSRKTLPRADRQS